LQKAAVDPDRTIRIYASEFLYDLADPRVVQIALDLLASASEDGRYNLILVIEGAYKYLPTDQRSAVAGRLREFRPKVGSRTQELIDRVLSGI